MNNTTDLGLQGTHITLVDLPDQRYLQEQFLKRLQSMLGNDSTLNVLPMVPGTQNNTNQSFCIPTNFEEDLRKTLKIGSTPLDDEQWLRQLRTWGAINVRTLHREAYFSMHAQRNPKSDAVEAAFTKLSVTDDKAASNKT